VPSSWTVGGGVLVIAAVLMRALSELRRANPRLKRGRPSPM